LGSRLLRELEAGGSGQRDLSRSRRRGV